MPVVLRIKGYRLWFYEADLDEPPHVHVGKEGKEAKYWMAPVAFIIPDPDEVRKFAAKLHVEGKPWKGEAFGWQAEYNPERPEPPLDSKMTFTPADFYIGESDLVLLAHVGAWQRGWASGVFR